MLHRNPMHTHNTRSSSYTMPLLNRPAHSKATLCDRSFYFASSSVWYSIPNDVRCAPSLSSFKSRLKTYLFRSVYKDWSVSLITVRLLFDLMMTSIENLLLQTHLNQTTIALNPTSIFQSLSLLPYTGLLGTLLTLTAHHLLLNFPVFQSFHLLKMQTSSVTFCALY